MKTITILFITLSTQISMANAVSTEMNKVILNCSGKILTVDPKDGWPKDEVATATNKNVVVINPWYRYGELIDQKKPQTILAYGPIIAAVRKGINTDKEVVLEAYDMRKPTDRQRIGFSAGEATAGRGLGLSFSVETGEYVILYQCQEAQ
ncbi:MAG: hypothetical protein H7061_04455 [Bdellovibrionaceae bacterium]|nr:hypothetical protein [Bdellovibrio sp.]